MESRKVYLLQLQGRNFVKNSVCYNSKTKAEEAKSELYRQIELYKQVEEANINFYSKHKKMFTCKMYWDKYCPIKNWSLENHSKIGKLLYGGFKEAVVVEIDCI